MEQKKEVKKEVQKEAVKVNTPKTIATRFRELGVKGVKDRKDMATQILLQFKNEGLQKNKSGKPITETKVLQQISAMLRDIKMERGKAHGSWWSKYTIVEDDKQLKLVPKN